MTGGRHSSICLWVQAYAGDRTERHCPHWLHTLLCRACQERMHTFRVPTLPLASRKMTTFSPRISTPTGLSFTLCETAAQNSNHFNGGAGSDDMKEVTMSVWETVSAHLH